MTTSAAFLVGGFAWVQRIYTGGDTAHDSVDVVCRDRMDSAALCAVDQKWEVTA